MAAISTSIRVSRDTLDQIERLTVVFGTSSADETIRKLIKERRLRALSRLHGIGRGRVGPFSEADRIAGHD